MSWRDLFTFLFFREAYPSHSEIYTFCGWKGSSLSGGEPPALFQLNSLSQSVPSKQKSPPLCYKGRKCNHDAPRFDGKEVCDVREAKTHGTVHLTDTRISVALFNRHTSWKCQLNIILSANLKRSIRQFISSGKGMIVFPLALPSAEKHFWALTLLNEMRLRKWKEHFGHAEDAQRKKLKERDRDKDRDSEQMQSTGNANVSS